MAEHNDLGNKGEKIARNHLEKKGYTILETNWRFRNLEIDLITQKGDFLVIIEVKTRRSNYFGEPESFVSKQQQKNLIRAANEYVTSKDLELEVRFDIVSILYNDTEKKTAHIEAAFYPGL